MSSISSKDPVQDDNDPKKPKVTGKDPEKVLLVTENNSNVTASEAKPEAQPYTNFSDRRRRCIILIITLAAFLGPVSGNIYIPLLPKFETVFNSSATTINATVSVFMFIFAFTPLVWASFADVGGRKLLYQVSLLFFIVANVLLAAVPANIVALFILRALQAFGASSVMSVGAGSIADISPPKKRATAMSYFLLGPQLGPVFGPIFSVIAKNDDDQKSWRWIFGFLAILGTAVYLLILFCLPETLRYLVGNGEALKLNGWFVRPHLRQLKLVEGHPKPPKPSMRGYWRMLSYAPVALSCINAALLFAGFYGISVTFSPVLQKNYGHTSIQASFSYVVPGASLVIGSMSCARISDYMKKHDHIPEHRIPLQFVGLLLSIAGLILYGWSVGKNLHVSLVYIATFINGFGMNWAFIITTTYLSECFKARAATGVALANMFRNAAAGVSSLIIHKLVQKMGYGWCFTGLGLCLLIAVTNVGVIWVKGVHWRHQLEQQSTQTGHATK